MSGTTRTKKSTNGTNSQGIKKESSFSYDELCRIIEVCRSSGVVQIALPGLSLKFDTQNKNVGNFVPEPNHEQNEKLAVEQNEIEVKEDQVERLLLEDPVEFERQIASGELLEDERDFESE